MTENKIEPLLNLTIEETIEFRKLEKTQLKYMDNDKFDRYKELTLKTLDIKRGRNYGIKKT